MLLWGSSMNENDSTTEQQLDPITTGEPVGVELAPITRIGVETELSRYPIHNLAKRGRVDIQIVKKRPDGEVDLKWEVSYSERHGQARQFAYKLDTLVINRKIDEQSRPLPDIIKLGTLREIAEDLGLDDGGGSATNRVKQALHQNAGAYITAKIKYRIEGGGEKTLEAGFTRYSVIFTGEKLPDGKEADAVYIILNKPFREVLNSAPVRPLNYAYLKSLSPAPQRFYEIISARIYAALKHGNQFARILYSDFCTYSALTRYEDPGNFRSQMAKIHQPHLKSGYIAKVHYEDQRDGQGNVADWMMCYKPGPRARAEYMAFARKSKRAAEASALAASQSEIEITDYEVGESPGALIPAPQPKREKPEPKHPLHDELIKRGISETKTKKILASLREGQEVLDQLEYVDHLIASEPRKFTSPPGFYIYFLTDNVLVPPNFETSRKRKNREAMQAAVQEETLKRLELEITYEQYQAVELDRFIETQLSQAEVDEITKRKRASIQTVFKNFALMPPSTQQTMLWGAVKAEVRPRVRLQSFQEFCQARSSDQMSLFSASATLAAPAPVSESQIPVPATAPELPQGELKPPRRGQGSQAQKTKPLEGKFEAREGAPKPPVASPAPQAETKAESATQAPAPDDRLLLERYNNFRAKEARRALDQVGMLERGRRLKDLRSKMLSDHPQAEEFRQMMADEEYEKFHKIVENHLIEVTLKALNLPSFEDWKRYALSAMGG